MGLICHTPHLCAIFLTTILILCPCDYTISCFRSFQEVEVDQSSLTIFVAHINKPKSESYSEAVRENGKMIFVSDPVLIGPLNLGLRLGYRELGLGLQGLQTIFISPSQNLNKFHVHQCQAQIEI